MLLEALPCAFSVCKLASACDLPAQPGKWTFSAVTDREVSLVCPTQAVPEGTLRREDGWRGLRVSGSLDFSLVGVLARLSAVLAEERISVFAVSTFDTDYLFTRSADFEGACLALRAAGYGVVAP